MGAAGVASVEDAVRARVAHEVVLDGWALRALGGPVSIPYPGLPLLEAAGLLGRHHEALRSWLPVRVGRTVAQKRTVAAARGDGRRRWATYEATGAGGLSVRYEPCRAAGRGAGMEVPVVWSEGPLDPGAYRGRPPGRWWGTAWMSLAERIPGDFEQVLWREPVFGSYRGGERFRGWVWRCPGLDSAGAGGLNSPPWREGLGRVASDDNQTAGAQACDRAAPSPGPSLQGGESNRFRGCGRRVQKLYAPLPAWTVGRALGLEEGLTVEGLAGQWLPGVMDRWAGRRSLACERCWRIQRSTFTNATGWNELVATLTGGLLYGREVEKPADFLAERRRAYRKRRKRRGEIDGRGFDPACPRDKIGPASVVE